MRLPTGTPVREFQNWSWIAYPRECIVHDVCVISWFSVASAIRNWVRVVVHKSTVLVIPPGQQRVRRRENAKKRTEMKRSNSVPELAGLRLKPPPPLVTSSTSSSATNLQGKRGLSTSNVSLPGDFARPEYSPRRQQVSNTIRHELFCGIRKPVFVFSWSIVVLPVQRLL